MTDSLQRNLSVRRLYPVAKPFPYALVDEFFRPAVYAELRAQFPSIGAKQHTLFWGDEDYERHLERSPSWKDVFDMVQSQPFVDFVIGAFGDFWGREGCTLDLSRVRYVRYIEDRVDKERLNLRRMEHDPHALWCRLDFAESSAGSYGPLHRDQRRRLISMLVYFDHPQDAASLEGGLILHGSGIDLRVLQKLRVGRIPRAYSVLRDRVAVTTSVPARPNRMLVLLNGNRSWHSAAKPPPARLPARHVRIVVSSSVDVWR